MPHFHNDQRGLTLIEMLVIAPFVMLFIGTLIFLLVQLSGNSLAGKEQATTAYNTQDALDNIEQDAYYAMAFPAAVSPQQSPQGSDDSTTAAFTSPVSGGTSFSLTGSSLTEANALIIKGPATTASPYTPSRQLVYATAPTSGSCGTTLENTNDVYPVYYVYFVKNSTLYRRSFLGDSTDSVPCPNDPSVWQTNSCASGVTINNSPCQSVDEALLNNVTSFAASYLNSSGNAAAPTSASTVSVTLTTSTTIAGKNVTYTATRYMSSANLQ